VHGAGYSRMHTNGGATTSRVYVQQSSDRQGYTVLDMDYRASAGLGRDWRTAIYRTWAERISMIRLMGAMACTKPWSRSEENRALRRIVRRLHHVDGAFHGSDVFAPARPSAVTDWAHYNQGYTSSILNISGRYGCLSAELSTVLCDGLKGRS